MIELKRLKLINWHNFENVTFDCARLTYMIGVTFRHDHAEIHAVARLEGKGYLAHAVVEEDNFAIMPFRIG